MDEPLPLKDVHDLMETIVRNLPDTMLRDVYPEKKFSIEEVNDYSRAFYLAGAILGMLQVGAVSREHCGQLQIEYMDMVLGDGRTAPKAQE